MDPWLLKFKNFTNKNMKDKICLKSKVAIQPLPIDALYSLQRTTVLKKMELLVFDFKECETSLSSIRKLFNKSAEAGVSSLS